MNIESYQKSTNKNWRNISTNSPLLRKVEKTEVPSSNSCRQCGQLRQPLPKVCHKEVVRQTESISREDKIAKFVGKKFFYFVSEAIMGEDNTFNTKEGLQIDKKFQLDYNSCYGKTVEKMRDNENIMQEISFSSVGKNNKTLTANLTRPQIKIPLKSWFAVAQKPQLNLLSDWILTQGSKIQNFLYDCKIMLLGKSANF